MSVPTEMIRIHINEAYSFRHVLSIAKSLFTEVCLTFDKKGLRIERSNEGRDTLYAFNLDGKKILDYEYNVCDDMGNIIPSIDIGVIVKDLFKSARLITKKDGFIMSILDNVRHVYSHVLKGSTRGSIGMTKIVKVTPHKYKPLKYTTTMEDPTIRTTVSDFATACNNISVDKCPYVYVHKCLKGITLKTTPGDKGHGRLENIGDCSNPIGKPKVVTESPHPEKKSSRKVGRKIVVESPVIKKKVTSDSPAVKSTKKVITDSPVQEKKSSKKIVSENQIDSRTRSDSDVKPPKKNKPTEIPAVSSKKPKFVVVEKDTTNIKIKTSITKALAKSNSLGSGSIVKIISEEDKPIYIQFMVGTYGTLDLYLKGNL